MADVIAVLTYKGIERILREGGTSSWTLNRPNARQLPFAVCTRNANHPHVEGQEPHGSAFLVGRIKDIVPAPWRPERWLVTFSEYAEIEAPQPGAWKGWRNPVHYTSFEELGIDPASLNFKPMPPADPNAGEEEEDSEATTEERPLLLTIAQAKQGLAATFGVSPEAIEITIRG